MTSVFITLNRSGPYNMSDKFSHLLLKFTPKIGHTFTDEREVFVEVPKNLVQRKSEWHKDVAGRCRNSDARERVHSLNQPIVVPEANAGWVLVPFFGAVLLLSARQLLRGKVTE